MSRLRTQYVWMEPIFGGKVANSAEIVLPQVKASLVRCWDKAMYKLENRGNGASRPTGSVSVT
jgi:hypothetical protein